jgi:hypothetical protein
VVNLSVRKVSDIEPIKRRLHGCSVLSAEPAEEPDAWIARHRNHIAHGNRHSGVNIG